MKKSEITILFIVGGTIAASAILGACGNGDQPQRPTASTNTSTTTAVTESTSKAANDTLEIDNYRFKLSPEIGKDGDTHMDLYIRDIKTDAHVPGAKVQLHLTAADGHKSTVVLNEEVADKHYGAKIKLDDLGEYQVVAQVTIDQNKFNPRFSFTRKE